jgi:uridine kinase
MARCGRADPGQPGTDTVRLMTSPSALDLAGLGDRVTRAPARLGRTRLVCVDGPAGSGKTTLAEALRTHLEDPTPGTPGAAGAAGEAPDVALVHMDDVYRGWDTDFDEVHRRLQDQVFGPLGRGEPARYQRYDWHAGRFADWVQVPVPRVLLLEGVASGAARLDPVRSLLVWIEADRDERLRRGVERDGDALLPQWLAWMEHEAAEHARQRTRERADVRLRGDGPAPSHGLWLLSGR